MPKGGNGGGGKPGSGDGGGSTSGPTLIRGDNSDNYWTIEDANDLLLYSYDGKRGNDTLNFSLLSVGLVMHVDSDTKGQSWISLDSGPISYLDGWLLSANRPVDGATQTSFVSIETIIGTSGDDFISLSGSANVTIDGGAGNDFIKSNGFGTDVLFGGAGDDILRGYDSTIMTGGEGADIFANAGFVTDYTAGEDRLLVEVSSDEVAALLAGSFTEDVDGNAIILSWRGDTIFTLEGWSAEQANALVAPDIIFQIHNIEGGEVYGGPGDDILLNSAVADNFILQSGGGDDTIVYPDDHNLPSHLEDKILFPEGVEYDQNNWTANSDGAYSYIYGSDSVTVVGLTFDQLMAMDITVADGAFFG